MPLSLVAIAKRMDTHRFKANLLVVKRTPQTIGFFVNVNLPQDCLEDGTLDQKLEVIRQVIGEEFWIEIPQRKVRYSVSAAYLLTKANGEVKAWKCNFQPRGNSDNTLRHFDAYNPLNFKEEIRAATSDHHVRVALMRVNDDTDWHFLRLLSVIVNFQTICDAQHVYSNRLLDLYAQQRLRRRRAIAHTRYFD